MQALRLVRARAPAALSRRCFAAAAAHPGGVSHSESSSQTVIPLSNVEAQWEKLSADEQLAVHQQLEVLQKRDWKTLSIDEKKAGELFFMPIYNLFDVLSVDLHFIL